MKTALIIGASGLIGNLLTLRLLEEKKYEKVKIVVRRKLDIRHPILEQIVSDFEHFPEDKIVADDIFCCLGTTMKKAGSKAAFEKVDYEYPLKLAQIALKNGATQYAIVTAMGADSKSMIYYNRVKGDIEKALIDLHFPNLMIFRPSMLLGDRKEHRVAEKIGIFFMKLLEPLTPLKYKGIQASKVAAAMSEMAQKGLKDVHIVESGEMNV
ncbi:MAG: oxidoreductase [Saprospiraceae bacterium]